MSSNPMNQSFMGYRTQTNNKNTKLNQNTQQNAQTNIIPKIGKINKNKNSLQQMAKKSRILQRKRQNGLIKERLKRSQMMNRSQMFNN